MITEPIPITPAPSVPDSSNPEAEFDAQWEAFNAWVRDSLRPGSNALAAAAFANATAAQESASAAETRKNQAASSASAAAISASQATSSKNAAAISATQAASSESAAAISASQAAATVTAATAAAIASTTASATAAQESASAAALDADRAEAAAESISGGPVVSVNGQGGAVVLPVTITVAYANRAQLRTNTKDTHALVDGLGLFEYTPGSTEPDDDESCFATATGRWLLQAAHWDLIDVWQLPEVEERDAYDEDVASKFLTGSATCAITGVASYSSVSFSGTVTGAAIGDSVIATPPAQLGATSADTWRLSYYAWVSAANTVTVALTNASPSGASTNVMLRAAWPITVIKS